MPKYLVRTNCEYSIVVEAESGQEAIDKVSYTEEDGSPYEWERAWAPYDAGVVE